MQKIYLQTARPVNKEDNGLNITSTWYEHHPKGYVLEKRERWEGHCYICLLYLRIMHLILQAASGPSIICYYTSEQSPHITTCF